MPKVTDDMIYIAWVKYSRGDIASPRKRMREALESVIETLPPTAEDLGLWISPDPEHSGWVTIPLPNPNAVQIWKKEYGAFLFYRDELKRDISGDATYHAAASFAVAYFDAHNAPLCKEHSLIGRCTLPEGHDGRHKRDVDSITFYWETANEV